MGVRDSMEFTLRVPDEENPELAQCYEEAIMPVKGYEGLRVDKFQDGWGVFEDDSEAPVTVRNVSVFETEEQAQEALEFYAEVRG